MKSILTAVLVTYVVLGAVLFIFQRKFIYFPSTSLPSREEFGASDMTEVTYRTADGLDLRAWFKPPARPETPVIVLFHGNGGHIGHRAWKARLFTDAGYGVLLAEYRGYGGNSGSPSEEGLYTDGRAALDFITTNGLEGSALVLYGESLGSAVVIRMAVERPVRSIILEAPFSSVADIARKRFPIYPTGLLLADQFDSMGAIREIDVPVLVVHGERDSVVPVEFGRRIFDAANEPKEGIFIKNADHNDLFEHGAAGIVLEFLQRLMAPVPREKARISNVPSKA